MMRARFVWLCYVLAVVAGCGVCELYAQDQKQTTSATPSVTRPDWAPRQPAFLSILDIGRVTPGQNQDLTVFIPDYEWESITTPRTFIETRTTEQDEEVVGADGLKKVDKKLVLTEELKTEDVTSLVARVVGHRQLTVTREEVQLFRLSDLEEPVARSDWDGLLQNNPTVIVILQEPSLPPGSSATESNKFRIDPFFSPLLKPDALVLTIPTKIYYKKDVVVTKYPEPAKD